MSIRTIDEERFDIAYLQNELYFVTRLVPRSKDQISTYIKEIYVYFDKDIYTVSSLKLVEPEGDYTSIRFTDQVYNESINDALFAKDN